MRARSKEGHLWMRELNPQRIRSVLLHLSALYFSSAVVVAFSKFPSQSPWLASLTFYFYFFYKWSLFQVLNRHLWILANF